MKLNFSILFVLFGFVVTFSGPVSHFGKLVSCTEGTKGRLCGSITGSSHPIHLKGPSLYWSTGHGVPFYNEATVDWLTANAGIGVIRIPMAIKYWKENSSPISMSDGNASYTGDYGYLSTATTTIPDPKGSQKQLVKTVIDAAIANDIYVIVDWHSHNADKEQSAAVEFFREMATEYKDVPNIIWEIYNEPVNASASTIKTYANAVISAIRNAGNSNLVLVGNSYYSQNPYEQFQQGLSDNNVAYVFHFYAVTHPFNSSPIKTSAQNVINAGVPVFGSEWGSTEASGGGTPSEAAASLWTNWMDDEKVSNCTWFVGGVSEQSSIFKDGTNSLTMSVSNLSTSGQIFYNYVTNSKKWTFYIPSGHPKAGDKEFSVKEGESVTLTSTQLGVSGTISGIKVNPSSGTATVSGSSIIYTSDFTSSPEKVSFIYEVTNGSVTVQGKVWINITERFPIVPDTSISVSYKASTPFTLSKLGITNPYGAVSELEFVSAVADFGTATVNVSKDSLTFIPDGSLDKLVSVLVTVKNKSHTRSISKTIYLIQQNQAPTIYAITTMNNKPNTEIIPISLQNVRAADKDGDDLTFMEAYLAPDYPGSVSFNATRDTVFYTPNSNYIGQVSILLVLEDELTNSKIGKVRINLIGNGQQIDVTEPNEIPGFVRIEKKQIKSNLGLKLEVVSNGFRISSPVSSDVSIHLFTLNGSKIATIWQGYVNIGDHYVYWDTFQLKSGIYFARLKAGSQMVMKKFTVR